MALLLAGPANLGARRDGQPALRLGIERGRTRGPRRLAGRGRPVCRRGCREHDPGALRALEERQGVCARCAAVRYEHRVAVRQSADAGSSYGIDSMGETAENVAADLHVSREDQDRFACADAGSCGRGARARALRASRSRRSTCPVTSVVRCGDSIRMSSFGRTRRSRSWRELKPAFRAGGSVTAGNSSGINDGAAALLVASERAVQELNLDADRPVSRRRSRRVSSRASWVWARCPATRQVLERARLPLDADRRDRAQRGVRGAGACVSARARAQRTMIRGSIPTAARSRLAIHWVCPERGSFFRPRASWRRRAVATPWRPCASVWGRGWPT